MCIARDQLTQRRWLTVFTFGLEIGTVCSIYVWIRQTFSSSKPHPLIPSPPRSTFWPPRTTTPTPSFHWNLCGEDEDDNSSEFFEVCYLIGFHISLFFFFSLYIFRFYGFLWVSHTISSILKILGDFVN